jgi:uncharacterized SAM-binding protein YcdF (DUF218 family)
MTYNLVCALGGWDPRKTAAVSVQKSGGANMILFTGEPISRPPGVTLYTLYEQFGANMSQIITPPYISTDTPGDVRVIQAVMQANNFTSVLVVDSNYHLPRTKMLFGRIFKWSATVAYQGVNQPITFAQQMSELGAYIREYMTIFS